MMSIAHPALYFTPQRLLNLEDNLALCDHLAGRGHLEGNDQPQQCGPHHNGGGGRHHMKTSNIMIQQSAASANLLWKLWIAKISHHCLT